MSWEICKSRSRLALEKQGYGTFLESGNGWTASTRVTSVSITCVPQNQGTILVLVSGGGALVREATRLFEQLKAADTTSAPAPSTQPAGDPNSGWQATALPLAGFTGSRFNFWCPPGGALSPVWGDGVYAAHSSVCTAAVHAGSLSVEMGGNAIIEIRPGRESYGGSLKHGVRSETFGSSKSSFIVVGNP